ncbi:hypothetical protein D7S86_21245 [Pararobbsia silviterrae]|uniref:Uncharacterized protein n=1 Tax=Pararobbsia silviterrae TaxID=1792498 RepID=A0A494XCR5_9BURK|nr:hypothetical protein D7S86_21245 [Pararobbsia silviterrae]
MTRKQYPITRVSISAYDTFDVVARFDVIRDTHMPRMKRRGFAMLDMPTRFSALTSIRDV